MEIFGYKNVLELKTKFVLLGSIIHSISFGEIEIIEDGMIIYGKNGVIEHVFDLNVMKIDRQVLNYFNKVRDYTGRLIIPGFIDAHCHAPQYMFSGTGMDLPLLAWLEKYTFPCEAKFSNVDFARHAYEKSIQRHLKCGTTFASYFATIHNEAGKVLVDIIQQIGQRAFVGKVSMDRNSPDFYIEDTIEGCRDAESFVKYVLSLSDIGKAFVHHIDNITTAAVNQLESDLYVGESPNNSVNNIQYVNQVFKRPRAISYIDEEEDSGSDENNVIKMSFSSSAQTMIPRNTSYASNNSNDNKNTDMLHHIDSDNNLNNTSVLNKNRSVSFDDSAVGVGISNYIADNNEANTINSSSVDKYDNNYEGSSDAFQMNKRLRSYSSLGNFDDYNNNNSSSSMIMDNIDYSDQVYNLKTLLNKSYTPLVMPCITPRFVPTCTENMMESLGKLSAKYGLPVQSHLSESMNEIQWVAELHPDCENYASVYQKYGLLHENVYMAHCCHSDKNERLLLATQKTGVVHCASSNFGLESGVMDVRTFITEGIKVALGTDVAGGYSPSMLDAIRNTIIASKVKLFESRTSNQLLASSVSINNLVATTTSTTNSDLMKCDSNSTKVEIESTNKDDVTTTNASTNLDNYAITALLSYSSSNNMVSSKDIMAQDEVQSISMNSSECDQEEEVISSITNIAVNLPIVTTTLTSNNKSNIPKHHIDYKTLSYKEVFHLATVGGAEVLGMDNVVGNFMIGKKLDCLVVDAAAYHGPIDIFDGEGVLEQFQKFLFLGDDRNITHVFVNGRKVI